MKKKKNKLLSPLAGMQNSKLKMPMNAHHTEILTALQAAYGQNKEFARGDDGILRPV